MAKKSKRLTPKTALPRSVEMPRRRVTRVGRNKPCPCGSGKKYKDCHAAEGEEFLLKLHRKQEKERLIEEQKKSGVPWYKRLITKALH
jgi:hypothetical protein